MSDIYFQLYTHPTIPRLAVLNAQRPKPDEAATVEMVEAIIPIFKDDPLFNEAVESEKKYLKFCLETGFRP